MDAAVITSHADPPEIRTMPDPGPVPDNSVVEVTAAPIVPLDLFCAGGTSYFGPPRLPYIPGVQGVGVIADSRTHPPGTRVFFTTDAGMQPGDGSMAQRCSVRDLDIVAIGGTVSDSAVAALGLSAVAAWMALSWRGNLQAGETVVVLAASGAVGQAALGAARALGAGRVIAVCRSDAGERRASRAGPDRIVRMSSEPDIDGLAADLRVACGDTADVVLDPVFGWAATAACMVLAPGGRLVNLGGTGGDSAVLSSSVLRGRSASILGYTNNALLPEQRAGALTAVLQQAEQGKMSVAHRVLPLRECAQGWRSTAAGGDRIVVVP